MCAAPRGSSLCNRPAIVLGPRSGRGEGGGSTVQQRGSLRFELGESVVIGTGSSRDHEQSGWDTNGGWAGGDLGLRGARAADPARGAPPGWPSPRRRNPACALATSLRAQLQALGSCFWITGNLTPCKGDRTEPVRAQQQRLLSRRGGGWAAVGGSAGAAPIALSHRGQHTTKSSTQSHPGAPGGTGGWGAPPPRSGSRWGGRRAWRTRGRGR